MSHRLTAPVVLTTGAREILVNEGWVQGQWRMQAQDRIHPPVPRRHVRPRHDAGRAT
jgi:hypothetical protein